MGSAYKLAVRKLHIVWQLVLLNWSKWEELALDLQSFRSVIVRPPRRLLIRQGRNIDDHLDVRPIRRDPFHRRLNIRIPRDNADSIAFSLNSVGHHVNCNVNVSFLFFLKTVFASIRFARHFSDLECTQNNTHLWKRSKCIEIFLLPLSRIASK
jgi:hypothetical protein